MTTGVIAAALHHGGLTALAGAAAIGAAATGWFGFGCAQDRQAAIAAQHALRQVEIANLNLQTGLERLRDESRQRVEQLRAQRDRLQARVGVLQRQLASLAPQAAPASPGQPSAARPKQATGRAPIAPAAAAAKPVARERQPTTSAAHAVSRTKNFTTPRWVPDFFSGESEKLHRKRASAPSLKGSRQAHRRETHRYLGTSAPAGLCRCTTSAGAGS